MKKFLRSCLIILGLAMQAKASADYCFPAYVGASSDIGMTPGVSEITVSPLFGKAEMKQGTVKEDGWLYGVKGNFDIISPNTLYLGAEIGYKFGDLKGNGDATFIPVNIIDPATRIETVTLVEEDNKTKSKYSDLWAELRVGFTFGGVGVPNAFVSPYFVVGYEREKDDFVSPSPLELKHTLTYGYLGCGAVSRFPLSNCLTLGTNVKFKWMFNSYAKTSGEKDLHDKGISPGNNFHWSIEVPLTWWASNSLSIGAGPFYEYKNYERHKLSDSGKEKASFHMWGGVVQLGYTY